MIPPCGGSTAGTTATRAASTYYNDWRDSTPWGHTRPDYGRPEVRQFLRDNALMWLEQYRFDGLRWDATSFIRNVYGGEDPGRRPPRRLEPDALDQ